MLTCPMCKKKQVTLDRECPSCHADLTLLIGFVENLAVGLLRAEELTREGRLADAVFAYLEVLEVDPENAIAKKQVGRVVTAVRNFDSQPPGRRRARAGWGSTLWLLIVLAMTALGFVGGFAGGMCYQRLLTELTRPTPEASAD
jgi:hypothetical protein